jgi:hypothetical protein
MDENTKEIEEEREGQRTEFLGCIALKDQVDVEEIVLETEKQ